MRRQVLDHGYIELVNTWGSDETIIEAARMSTAKGFQGWGTVDHPGDEKLLRYLWTNSHHTPFEMGGLTIEVQAPIFVFREWHRHRTQSYNELSARCTPLPDLNYVPSHARLSLSTAGTNKQAGRVEGAKPLTMNRMAIFQEELSEFYALAQRQYERALDDGVPKELARLFVPVARYSRMRASANLRNWLGFLKLRRAPNAQWEIQQYANEVGALVQHAFPRTWDLFAETVA